MSVLKKSSLFKCYLFIALCCFVFLGLMLSSQAMAGTRYQETAPMDYTGEWTPLDNGNASGGHLKYSNDLVPPEASCSFTFTGTSISWIGFKQYNMGISEVWIDEEKVAEVDLYAPGTPSNPNTLWKQVLYTSNNLPSGEHTITIKPTNQKNPLSSGLYTDVDAFDVCSGTVCVVSPHPEDVWKSGEAHPISLAIDTSATSQYRLYLRCGSQGWSTKNSITLRQCNYYGVCPDYTWSIPPVPQNITFLPCQIGVQLFNSNLGLLAQNASEVFFLQPSGPPAGFSIEPLSQTVPQGGSANYVVKGGTPPYQVATLLYKPNLGIDFSITRIDGFNVPQTYTNPTNTFTVQNISCAPCPDQIVVIGAQDTTGARTFASYQIRCDLSLKPSSATVHKGGLAEYTICGGTPPYHVATIIGGDINFDHTTIDGIVPTDPPGYKTFAGSGPHTFTIADDASCTETTYTVGVQDNTDKIAVAKYVIDDCP